MKRKITNKSFDEFYSKNFNYFSQIHSDGLENCLNQFSIRPCVAVDIGAGEGRNSLFLAKKGFRVIAIEPSSVGAEKIKKSAELENITIEVKNGDFITEASSLENIEFVLALTSLEHMDNSYLSKTILEIKRMMKPGGYIYVVVFTDKDPGFKKDFKNASECSLFIKHYFKENELKKYFDDFDILIYKEYLKVDTSHGPKHYHGKAKLFARKPLL